MNRFYLSERKDEKEYYTAAGAAEATALPTLAKNNEIVEMKRKYKKKISMCVRIQSIFEC